jgi:Cu+-exporting ATPase
MESTQRSVAETCFHCGEDCTAVPIHAHDHNFCCTGCKMVYEILNQKGLCDYYTLNDKPGINRKQNINDEKFNFLDDNRIAASLIDFKDAEKTRICFYLPQMHCSSCLWLLENLHKLNENIGSCKVNFARKEADIIFDHNKINLRKVAELLSAVGYEPYISLNDTNKVKAPIDKSRIYKLGVAGFCFANIMLFSFPEYLGIDEKETQLLLMFRYLNVILSLPVFFYSASEFYISAWKSLKHKFLNIDAPIVLAVWVTFGRSLYEIFTGTGSGYFDSMSGIVFFMLIGRVLQRKTYDRLNFERDYTSYFPVSVTKVEKDGSHKPLVLPEIKLDDTLLIHNEELIPADGILTRGKALIDYSFVTGESIPVVKETGEIVYAGGKQVGTNVEILVIKEVAQSYLTKLWNKQELKSNATENESSFVHSLSRYFTWIVLAISVSAGIYWMMNDPTKTWNALTAVMIVACPCALLLSNSFTNGNVLRKFSNHKLYLRNAEIIEKIADTDVIVFDKTGTLTQTAYRDVSYKGQPLSKDWLGKIAALSSQSMHPLSKAITAHLPKSNLKLLAYKEHTGQGIEGIIEGDLIMMGSKKYIGGEPNAEENVSFSEVYVALEGKCVGKFSFKNHYRDNIPQLLKQLKNNYRVVVLSGDNASEKNYLQEVLGPDAFLYFKQSPEDKLSVIKQLQSSGKKVMMLGDGLNDAGALKQADTGIAVTDDSNNFTPSSDAIIEAKALPKLLNFITVAKANKHVVLAAFIVSIIYNIIGITIAVTGNMSPMIAAILMPVSSLSIVLITFGCSSLIAARRLKGV